METDIKIGPYKITQRTKYSKLKVFDCDRDEYIDNYDNMLIKKIIKDYNKQIDFKDDVFAIDEDNFLTLNPSANDLNYLFIPEDIYGFDENIFDGITIKMISLPSTLTYIERETFKKQNELKQIEIPDAVSYLGPQSFVYCKKLEKVKLPLTETITGHCFHGCESLNNVVIPDSVKKLGTFCFSGCISLNNIVLSKNLELIDNGAFEGCRKLSKINLPNKIKYIGRDAFADCVKLHEIEIPNSVKILSMQSFGGCDNLRYIKLSNNIKTLEEETFKNCKHLKNIILPDEISTLENDIFDGTMELEDINIPRNLESIIDSPFSGSSIKTLIFNHSLKKLETNNLDLISDSNINKLVIHKNVKIITPKAFNKSGKQITTIKYYGNEEEFNKFKENNKELFDKCLINVDKVIFSEEKKEDKEIYMENIIK